MLHSMYRSFLIACSLLLLLASCKSRGPGPESVLGQEAAAAPSLPRMNVDPDALDRSVEPCEDFYRFACGGWVDTTTIPADRPAWYRSFSEIQEHNLLMLRRILDDTAAGWLKTPYGEKLGAYWATCMDEEEIPEESVRTLREALERIEGVSGKASFAREVARLQSQGVDAFFGFGSMQDFRDVSQMIAAVDQGGLGLPDREYYLRQDERSRDLREAYAAHIAKMLVLSGVAEASASSQAEQILQIETALAEVSMPRVDRRDPYKVYNRLDRAGLQEAAPTFDWAEFFKTMGKPDLQAINVTSPEFFSGFSRLLQERPMGELQAYLRWHLIDFAAPALTAPFVEADFAFSSKLSGEEEILPRWKRCIASVDGAMGQALSRPFVAETFAAESKETAQELIRGIEAAFERSVEGLDWMDDSTRKEALIKLEKVKNKIGYPEKWRSYDSLEVSRSSFLENRFAANRFETKRDLHKIGKPVDRDEWYMSPSTVNAYYNSLSNEMVFPAGILQSPFFSLEGSAAANAGAIGMVMGHELTHGFDDKGREFDADGNLRDWWSPEVAAAYTEKAQCVVDQYDAYTILGDVHLNGQLTLGENIADIGGLQLAWSAFADGRELSGEKDSSGFTEAQQFFLSFAQSWCAARRPDYARLLVTVDSHSPPEFRVNGAVTNAPQFQEAFACPAGSPMAPADRCEIW